MASKIQRFLSSIGIEDVERFDLSFILIARNPYNQDQVDMAMEKSSPWEYPLLDEFIQALSTIRYPYTLRFSYGVDPTAEDAADLFYNWYFMRYQDVPGLSLASKAPYVLSVVYPSQESKDKNQRALKDFRDLLKFVNYPFSILEEDGFGLEAAPEKEPEPQPEPEPEPEPEPQPEPIMDPSIGAKGLTEEEESMDEALNMASDLDAEEKPVQEEEPVASVEPELVEEVTQKEPEAVEEEPVVEEPEPVVEEPEPDLSEGPEEDGEPCEPEEDNEPEPEDEDESEEEDETEKEAEPSEPEEEVFIPDEEEAARLIEEEAIYYRTQTEDAMFDQHQRRMEWKKEQENRERVWSKGNYRPLKRISEIFEISLCNVDFEGEVFQVKPSLGRNGHASNSFSMGDATGAVNLRAFEGRIKKAEVEGIKVGDRYRIRGAIDVDKFTHQKVIIVHFMNKLPKKVFRKDEEEVKRVELHLHTNMSTMDGIASFGDFYDAARAMGMKAIGLCDHGGVQSFPAAQAARAAHADSLSGKDTDEKPLKILYGCEMYMFDIAQRYILNPSEIALDKARYCVFDTETTGLSSRHDKLIEFGGVIMENGRVVRSFGTLINPQIDLSQAREALAINKIEEAELLKAPTLDEVLPQILEFMGDCVLVAHNATFDVGFLNAVLEQRGLPPITNPVIDTLALSHYLFPAAGAHNEGALLRRLGLADVYDVESAHRAEYDATALSEGWVEILSRLSQKNPSLRHCDLEHLSIPDPEGVMEQGDPNDPNDPKAKEYAKAMEDYRQFCRHLREYHVTVYAKNKKGIHDLFYVLTQSLIKYIGRVPRTPRELIAKYRENFLIGSACFNGEIFEIASTRNQADLVKAMEFYDFIEIQPLENYSYLLNMGRIASKERLISYLRDIVDAARVAGKKVVATGDAHYVDPSDKIYRDIMITAKGIGNGTHPLYPPARKKVPHFDNPDQHFRSTREMLDAFREWCTEAEAQEFVVTNSNLIADQIEDDIEIVSEITHTPNVNLPNSETIIRNLCETNFHKNYDYLFGDDDPEVKKAIDFAWDRMQRELSGIIGSGYAVTYYIAHCLIKRANQEPERFIVGSRGSVGSSFAATMAEITEVNPLPAHYHCPKCHYLHFEDTSIYRSGFDLPNKVCPKCGAPLESNGQNIPFETFLGFHADKVPDIDLNFEDESQKRAHNYCKDLLGANNVFRCGTIETVADKTAFGFVRGYFEEIGRDPSQISSTYIAYLASHCQGVKRTTGRHPGGIVVVPADMDVYDFTAVQYPADDDNSDWLTTHFDFRAMHDEILKLDILGHVDPMAMRYYRDLTGVDIESIPMNDPKVLSLFSSVRELKMHRNFLEHDTGAAALPEFGTNQGMQMLSTLRPKTFNDLIIISGLAHGTNVWAGNAEDLVTKQGKTINEIIGCRDEIMTYLISMGMDSSLSFKIMEAVRKGKKLRPEQEQEMRSHGVPDFYIDSCNKIAYLFPRGHATAYVTMAVRVAYFKLYYPLEFYAVYFSIRAKDWDIKTMIEGEDSVIARIQEWRPRMKSRDNPLSTKETDQYKTLLVAVEMLQRGYKFLPLDLYRSDAKMFLVDHERGALIPPFSVIDGLGLSAAQSICEAREEVGYDGKKRPFISKQDLLDRASKLSSAHLKKLDELGVLSGLSEKNQGSIFDFM
ncbi:MAG: PolC-type DNA polymerase III [Bacilli bacterium]|nr:PolC-type DNA polymerase III [Bacilli bacterium]